MVDGNAPAKTGSISTASTFATLGRSARVKDPRPGPISTTTSDALTCA